MDQAENKKLFTLCGINLTPITHIIVVSITATEEEEYAANELVIYIEQVNERKLLVIKDVMWKRSAGLHNAFASHPQETTVRIPIVIGYSKLMLDHFGLTIKPLQEREVYIITSGATVFLMAHKSVTKILPLILLEQASPPYSPIEGNIPQEVSLGDINCIIQINDATLAKYSKYL